MSHLVASQGGAPVIYVIHLALPLYTCHPHKPVQWHILVRIFDCQLTHRITPDKAPSIALDAQLPSRPRIQIDSFYGATSTCQSPVYTFYIMRATKRTDPAGLTAESRPSLFISIYGLIGEIYPARALLVGTANGDLAITTVHLRRAETIRVEAVRVRIWDWSHNAMLNTVYWFRYDIFHDKTSEFERSWRSVQDDYVGLRNRVSDHGKGLIPRLG